MNIKEQITEVLKYSQNYNNINIDKIYEQWQFNKRFFIDVFKDKLIYEIPKKITFSLSDEVKQNKYEDFVEKILGLIPFYNSNFCEFLTSISINEFFNNSLEKNFKYKDIIIPKGTKVLKAFKYFIEDKELLMEVQNIASMLIQEDKIEGYLCFSVHPLDFLSSSENTFNWRSCHSLDGEYRQGNLSYMLDSSTFICYLKSEKDAILPNFPDSVPWNNKKWRCLMFISTDKSVVFAGRQYPFFAPGALETIREELIKILPKESMFWYGNASQWSYWHNDYINDFQYKEHNDEDTGSIHNGIFPVIRNGIYNLNRIIKNGKHSAHFNDLLNSSVYTKPYYMWKKTGFFDSDIRFEIGKSAPCLICGDEGYEPLENSMLCYNCENKYGYTENNKFFHCDRCGRHSACEDGVFVEGELICPTCVENETFICAKCGDRYYNDEKVYLKDIKDFVCKDCLSIY